MPEEAVGPIRVSHGRDLRRETFYYSLALFVGGLVQIAFLPFISSFLTADAAGELGTLRVISEAVAGIVVLGLPTALIRAWHRTSAHRMVLVRGMSFPLIPALLSALLVLLLGRTLTSVLHLSTPGFLGHALLLGISAAYVQIVLAFPRADGLAGRYLVYQVVRGLASLAGLWALLKLTTVGAIDSFMVARWLPSFAMVLAAGAFMWVRTSESRSEAPPATLNRELFSFSLPLVPAGLALIVLSSSDMFMLRVMSPSLSESGYYEWASRVCLGLMPLILGFDMAWKRYIFRKKETGGTIAELGRAGLLFMVLVNWISMLLAMASPPIVAALGGGEFWPAVRVLPTLAAASAMYGLFLISQTGCLLTGQTKYVAWMTLFGAMLNIGFNMRLIPVAGALGAAFATMATNLFMALSLFWLGRKVFPISFLAVTLTVIPPLTFGPLATLGPGWRAVVVLAGSLLTVVVVWLLRLMGTTLSPVPRE